MKMQRRDVLCAAAALAWISVVPAAWADDAPDPFALIVDLNNAVLDEIRRDPKLHAGDPERLRALVDRLVMPNVDFPMMTRMAVGPKWRTASEDERRRLEAGFKNLLIRVYSGALTSVKDERCELRPTRSRAVREQMVIRTLLKSGARPEPIGLDYRIYRTKAGEWKIVDVNVEGIWMVENYRTQFASILGEKGVAGLLEVFEKRMDEFAAQVKAPAVKS